MSNVIKAYYVRYDNDEKKTIDTHLKFAQEIEVPKNRAVITPESNEGFIEGLNAVVVEEIPTNEELNQKTSKIVEDAKKEAKGILDQAKKDADKIKNDAFQAAQKKGYEEGMLQARKEAQKLKAEYEENLHNLQKEYGDKMLSLEPQMAEIMASLIEKITGILVEDKEEVILYLINRAITNMDKSKEYTIRVSKEDYEYISMRKDMIQNAVGRKVDLFIIEDSTLEKNQCLIETETRMINCSLDVQLSNLITDIKLIGGV